MDEKDFKLNVKLDNREVEIGVIDFLPSERDDKEYLIYTINGLPKDQTFVSILNEKEDSYSLDTIESEEEYAYVNNLIAKSLISVSDENEN